MLSLSERFLPWFHLTVGISMIALFFWVAGDLSCQCDSLFSHTAWSAMPHVNVQNTYYWSYGLLLFTSMMAALNLFWAKSDFTRNVVIGEKAP